MHDSALPLPLLGLSSKVVDGQAICENTKERKHSLSRSLSLSSLRHQMNSTLVPLLASLSLQARVCADGLESTLDARDTRL